MADIEDLNGGDNEELLLTDTLGGGDGADTLPAAEAIDDIEYPETLDDETDPALETPLIKQLREQRKEDARRLREKDRELEQLRGKTAPQRVKKPDLWDDCEGDPDKFEEALLAWKENEQAVERAATAVTTVHQRASQRTQEQLTAYRNDVVKLAKPDFKASEDAVVGAMSDEQQIVLIKVAKHPAKFIDALGRSPVRLAQLAEITDLIELAAEVARIEGKSLMAHKTPANIDAPLKGGARLSNVAEDAEEKRLEKDAERTKDYSKLFAYRRNKRKAA